MQKIYMLVLSVIFVLSMGTMAEAEIPHLLNLQGFLVDDTGPVTGEFEAVFRIYDAPNNGNILWQETDSVSVVDGLYSVNLGGVNPIDIVFDNQAWIGVQFSGHPEMTPRYRQTSVPFTFVSEYSDSSAAVSDDAITSGKILNGTITQEDLSFTPLSRPLSPGVATEEIADNAITGAKLASDIIDSTKIQNGSVSFGDIGQNGATAGQVIKWDGSMWISAEDMTGSAGWNWSDSSSHGPDSVHYSDLAIQANHSDHSDSTDAIADGGVDFADIGQNGAVEGQVMKWNGSAWAPANDESGTGGDADWVISGNNQYSGVTGNVGIGTATPAQKLDVDGNVYASGWARIGPGHTGNSTYSFFAGRDNTINANFGAVAGRYNVVGGIYSAIAGGQSNTLSSAYSFIGGGLTNQVNGHFGAIGGGRSNVSGDAIIDTATFVGGGLQNSSLGRYSSVTAGLGNISFDDYSTIGGGSYNQAHGQGSTIGGGEGNSTNGLDATIGGGDTNNAGNIGATISGGIENAASGMASTIGGGSGNIATGTNSTIPGGANNIANGSNSAVGGGSTNTAGGTNSTVAGGFNNNAGGYLASIVGGQNNLAEDSAAFVGGGKNCFARGAFSTVAGGGGETLADSNSAMGRYTTVGGGQGNKAQLAHSTVSGGRTNWALGYWATVGGGGQNIAGGTYAAIGGGNLNTANATDAAIAGGYLNFVGGHYSAISGGSENNVTGSYGSAVGWRNDVSGQAATVGGGLRNLAAGNGSTIPGGEDNAAIGHYSIAAGNDAKANHNGSVVIAAKFNALNADSVRSGGDQQMVFRADGGIYITNIAELAPYDPANIITTRGGAYLSGNGTTWTNASDKNLKENFRSLDKGEILEKISSLPISEWNYKSESNKKRHIGPVAQDFYEVFGLGGDDKTISTIDPSGVALAGLQELIKELNELKQRNAELESRISELESGR